MKKQTLIRLFGILTLIALVVPVLGAAAQDSAEEAIELPEVDPLSVTGDIISAGSSTVFPLSSRMAERFEEDGYSGTITVDSIGSGAGYERFCVNAETDIANASRAIKEDEIAACEENGRTPIEFRVGTDALAIVVSTENDWLEGLTLEQLGKIFGGEYKTWADVDAMYPAEPIELFSPGTDSGTFDYFVEVVMRPIAKTALEAEGKSEEEVGDGTPDKAEEMILGVEGTQFSENDNALVEGVAGNPYAIGYFGFAYLVENSDVVRALNINDVTPNEETAESNEYPLSRPLFIYSDATIMAEKPQVAAFINYYLSNVDDEIVEVGYFPASVEALNAAKQAWADAMGIDLEAQ